jgi:small subunit ribosomal protein S1
LGTELNVVVIQITDKGVMVSVKRMSKDPWLDVETLYQVNHQAKGKITKLQGYGAFVELSDGIQGLLHKKEMSLDGMKEPSEIVSEGQEIDVIITSIEKAERKMSFSIKPFLN